MDEHFHLDPTAERALFDAYEAGWTAGFNAGATRCRLSPFTRALLFLLGLLVIALVTLH